MKYKCVGCDHSVERMAAQGLLSMVCPSCNKLLTIAENGLNRSLTFAEFVVGGVALFAIYKMLSSGNKKTIFG
jgi:hypothetical protein